MYQIQVPLKEQKRKKGGAAPLETAHKTAFAQGVAAEMREAAVAARSATVLHYSGC